MVHLKRRIRSRKNVGDCCVILKEAIPNKTTVEANCIPEKYFDQFSPDILYSLLSVHVIEKPQFFPIVYNCSVNSLEKHVL